MRTRTSTQVWPGHDYSGMLPTPEGSPRLAVSQHAALRTISTTVCILYVYRYVANNSRQAACSHFKILGKRPRESLLNSLVGIYSQKFSWEFPFKILTGKYYGNFDG